MSVISQSISRSPIGLSIDFWASNINEETSRPLSFVDETFMCTSSNVECLLEHLKERRGDVISRLDTEKRISLFVPQGDPPIIQVTRATQRTAYFTLGELVRWRFIRHFPLYPLKVHQKKRRGLAPKTKKCNSC